MQRELIIVPPGRAELDRVVIGAREATLEELQAAVGGYIERVAGIKLKAAETLLEEVEGRGEGLPLGFRRQMVQTLREVWADEEGLVKDLPMNRRATRMLWDSQGESDRFLVGPVVLEVLMVDQPKEDGCPRCGLSHNANGSSDDCPEDRDPTEPKDASDACRLCGLSADVHGAGETGMFDSHPFAPPAVGQA